MMLIFNEPMRYPKAPLRLVFFSFLLVCLLTGLAGISRAPEQVKAAPPKQSGTADLSVTISVDNATPGPGKTDNITFTITVTNTSTTDDATGVTVQDILPAGLTYVSDTGGGAYNSGSGIWTIASLGASGSISLNITATVITGTPKTNTAQITASTPTDPNAANNSASVNVTPIGVDLSLAMTVSNTTPNKADPVIFTITITNNSTTDTATGVTVKDLLPAGLTYVSDSGAGTYNKTTGIWVVGTVLASSTVTLNIITNLTATLPQPVPANFWTNSAEIWTSDQLDPDSIPGNSSTTEDDDDSRSLTPNASDVSLTMNLQPPGSSTTPSVGDIVTFHITVTNGGPVQATGVKVTDLLPTGLMFISYTSSSGTYTSSTGNWSVGNLTTTTPKTLDITASVTNTAAKTNVAEVTDMDQLDPDSTPANGITTEDDYASISLNSPLADLAVTMSVNNTAPNKADNVIFTITLTNNGPATATGVTVKDLLPAGLTFISYTSSTGSYTSSSGVWLIGTVPVSSTNTLTITTRPSTTGAKVNTVSILTSNQADTTTTNNSASVTVTPKSADLSITKKIDKNAPNTGDLVKFTITLNNAGPSTASGVMVLDLLPPGYSYVVDDSGGAYNDSTGIWTVGSMAVNTNRVLNITARATTNSNKTNEVEVLASDQLDPDSTPNNSSISEDDDDAAPKVDLSLTKTVSTTTPSVGSKVIFTLAVSNAGPAAATGVIVRDILPANLAYQSDTGGGAYNNGTGMWTVGTLAVGASKTLQITVKGTALGAYVNSAEVWASDQYDIDSVPGNNSTTEDDDAKVSGSVSYAVRTILINEVAWMGTAASTNDEWIELYNPGSSPINLSGWVLKAVDGTPSITLNAYTLQPGEYYLLERTDDTTVSDIDANQIYTGELGNSYETLRLIDPLNRVIDTANANGGLWPAGSSSTFGSMERRGVVADSDTAWITNTGKVAWGKDAGNPNNCTITPPCLTAPKILKGTPKGPNWAYSVTPTPSPQITATHRPTFTVVPPLPLVAINEFVPRPGHDWNGDGKINTGDEYIELLNHGVIDVNLNGYRLDDEANIGSAPYTLPNVTIKPGERIVFYGDQTGLLLSDGGDGVRLLKPNGQLMDAFNYTIVGYPDQAYCRLPDDGGADDWNDSCYPTPGLRNAHGSFGTVNSTPVPESLCPFSDLAPADFVIAECDPFGNNIWRPAYWDDPGWLNGQDLPKTNSKWEIFAD
jgi:uncharacterized repeat protein (TIGR01451 family)